MKKNIILIFTVFIVTGCTAPKEEATNVAKQACLANKNSDMTGMANYMSEEIFKENKEMHELGGDFLKPFLKMLDCGVENISEIEDGRFVVNFKKHNSYEVAEVNGDLKVVAEEGFF